MKKWMAGDIPPQGTTAISLLVPEACFTLWELPAPKPLFILLSWPFEGPETEHDIQDKEPIGSLSKRHHRHTQTLSSSRFDALLKNSVFRCRRVCWSRNFKLHLSALTGSAVPVSLCFPGTFRGASALHHTSHCRMLQASASSSQHGNRRFESEEGLSHRRGSEPTDTPPRVRRQWLCAELRLALQMCQPLHSWSHKCRASWCALQMLPLPSPEGTSASHGLGRSCTFAGLSQHDHSLKSKFTGIKQQKTQKRWFCSKNKVA